MKSTRERILQTLLNNPQSTINELAEAVSINSISVRHHLTNLQAEGLVQVDEERHGVGRPRLVYSLTDNGAEKFPTRYLNLTNLLLTQLKSRLPKKEIDKMLSQIGTNLAAELPARLRNLSIEERLSYMQNELTQQGYSLEWKKVGDDYIINEISCPFYHVGQAHPEVCMIDQNLISSLLSLPIDRVNCVLTGDNYCSFMVKHTSVVEEKP